LSADRARAQAGDLIVFTLAVTNNTDRPLQLDAKPAQDLNNGQHALANGELLRAVEARDGKERLREPELFSVPGILPPVSASGVEQVLAPGATREFRLAARVEGPGPRGMHLVFDDPESPGLKRYGPGLYRRLYFFQAEEGKISLRCVYDRGGLSVSSNDLVLQLGKVGPNPGGP
jgi:hypothetical protein